MFPPTWRPRIHRPASSASGKRRRRSARPLDVEHLEDRCLLATSLTGLTDYGQVPLSFEANQGQTDAQVSFLSRGSGYALFLTPTEAVLHLQQPSNSPGVAAAGGDVIRMQLLGSNPAPQVQGLDQLATTSNYFIGNDPSQWRTGVANFGQVTQHDVYPGVDLVYYGNQRQLEYDFNVAPGADPGAISFSFQGATSLSLDAQGNLVLHTAGGDVVEHAPVMYQDGPGGRQTVSGHYVLGGDGRVSFAVGAYDPSRTLVIDPVLSYSTYLGGSGPDKGNGIAVDSFGNAYVIGTTLSVDFPVVSSPALQPTNHGGFDIFITKVNSSGAGLAYSTFLGGSGSDVGNGIAVDQAGNVTFTGYTNSPNYPVVAAAQPAFGGGNFDAVAGKLNPTGTALTFNTYLGGNGDDFGFGITLDAAGSAYLTGSTASTNAFLTSPAPAGPLTYRNAFKSTDGGNSWGTSNTGILDATVTAWAFGPAGTIYAGTAGTGVYKSTNSGVNWAPVNSGLTNFDVRSLVTDTAGNIYAGTAGGVFKSTNGGASWTPVNTGLTNLNVQALGISASGVLFAGTGGGSAGGMFVSSNGGTNWTASNTGFTNINVPVPDITVIRTDPTNANVVYAGTAGGGVFKSTNAGTTWTPIVNGLFNFNIAALAIDPANANTVYATTHGDGVFRSLNGGASWSSYSAGLQIIDPNFFEINTTSIAVDSSGQYVGTDAGVFKFDPTLGTWRLSNAGLSNLSVTALAADPFNPGTLFAGAKLSSDVFAAKLTPAGGVTYADHFGGAIDEQGHAVAVDAAGNAFITGYTTSANFPVNPPATAFQVNNGDQKSFKTTDGGATWAPNDINGLPRGSLLTLAINPAATTTVYAGTAGSGVFVTTNGGGSWAANNTGLRNLTVHILAVDPKTLQIYAGTDNGVQFSANTPTLNWNVTGLTGVTVTSLAIVPQPGLTPSILYAGTAGSGLFKSTDGGLTWAPMNTGLTNLNVKEVAVNPLNANILLVGTAGGGVFRSVNAGATWASDNGGLPGASGTNPVLIITALAYTIAGVPYIGVNNGNGGLGVFTPDINGNWAAVNTNLKDLNITFLAPDPTNSSVLYAGTQNGGIFVTTDGGVGWSQDNGSAAVNGNSRLTNFQVATIAIDPTNPLVIYAGFLQSLSLTADVFVAEVNAAGTALPNATYLGGNGDDVGQGIALDAGGNVYLTGYTSSGAFPLLHPLLNQSVIHPGGTFHYDAFVTKMNTSATALFYSTFLGGGASAKVPPTRDPAGDDYGNAIAVDTDGSAVVVGNTTSVDFVVTDTAFQAGFGGGINQGDAFVTRIPADPGTDFTGGLFPNGDPAIFSSYLGGSGDDSGNGVALDPSGNIYVTGFTGSANFPTVTPAQAALGGPASGAVFTDAFVSKIIPVPTTMTLTVTTSPSALGGQFVDVTLTGFHFVVGNAPLGTIYSVDTFFDGPAMLGHGLSDGKGNSVLTIRGVSIATPHEYFVYFGGDKNHMPSKSLPVSLVPTVTQLTSAGGGASFTATVVPTTGGGVPTGYVTFVVNSTVLPGQPGINPPEPGNPNVPGPDNGDGTVVQFGIPLVNGTATYTPPFPFTPGTYTITAVYSGDLTFMPSTSAPLSQAIPQAATSTVVTAAPASSVFGQAVTFTATVSSLTASSGVPSGSVRFNDGGTVLGTVTLGATGIATFTTSALGAGTHAITAFYLGSPNFATSSSAVLSYVVGKASTATALAAAPTPPQAGQPVTLTATVTVLTPGAGTPTGSVTFTDGLATLGQVALAPNGTASFTISSLTAGAHQFVAVYSGDNSFNGSTSPPLSLGPTQTTLAASTTQPALGQVVTFTATVAPLPPAVGNPTGTVTFFDGGVTIGTGAVAGGKATFQTSALTAGNHVITASYGGDNFFTPSTSNVVNVFVASPVSVGFTSNPNPSGVGQAVTIAMAITGSAGGPVPTGTVQFSVDGAAFGGPVPLDATGTATISTSALAFGTHALAANYSGDAVYAAASAGPISQVVEFLANVGLTSSSNPSALGATVTFTAVVTGVPPAQGAPTGTVTFMDGSTALATVALDANGTAVFRTRSLTAGNHPITAVYSGDANFAPNTSAVLLQGVQLNAIFVTGADAGGGPNVLVFDSVTGAVKFNFFAYDPGFVGGVRVGVGDVNGDGYPDVITAPGPGGGPDIHVYDGKTGNLFRQFFAYNPLFTGGQYLASSDLNGDGFADVIIGADKGGGPNVIAFSGKDGSVMYNFMAYDINFTGGVRVAGGDVNGDGFGDIITGPGPGGGPNVKVFSGSTGALMSSFSAFNPFEAHGLFLAAGDVNGDGRDEVIVSLDAGIGPTVGVYDGIGGFQLQAFYAYDPLFTGGVRVGIRPNKFGTTDILTVAGPGGGADVKTFSGANDQLIDEFFAYNPLFTGGLFVAGGR